MYLICPLPTKPDRSLSKTWKPRMYSSMSKGSRKPPGRLRILEKVSKSTAGCQRSRSSLHMRAAVVPSAGEEIFGRTVCAHAALQIANLSQRRVLATCAQQVAQRAAVYTAVAALVEQLERFAVVGRGLIAVIHCCSVSKNQACGAEGEMCVQCYGATKAREGLRCLRLVAAKSR
jgi:hypothetical protein